MEKGISRHFITLIAVAAVAAMGLTASAAKKQRIIEHVKGELIVKLRDSNPGPQAQAAVYGALEKALGTGQVLAVRTLKTDSSVQKIRLKQDSQLMAAISALTLEPAVKFAEPNFIYRTFDEERPVAPPVPFPGQPPTNDTEFSKLWGIFNYGQSDAAGQAGKGGADVNVVPLWAKGITGSKNVIVAVIDTGVDYTHPDLAANVYTNAKEIPGNGIDDDHNGFIDDVHGWNFEAGTAQSKDDHNHGSHCSGTIGAIGNNGQGVVGVNWNVTLLPVKFLSASGSGSLEGAVESINYARKMNANIMSNSWGGGGMSEVLKEAIEEARDAGILFVAAAGNESNNNDSSPTYPAGYQIDNVLAVAAIDNQEKIASFSNFGRNTVHVAAPGVKVFSTGKDGQYLAFSGTSMACPHAAGVAALLLSTDSTLTYAQLKERLIRTSEPVSGLRRKVVSRGRINAYNAYMDLTPPSTDPDEALWRNVRKVIESEHPYKDNDDKIFTIKHEGAKFIRVVFEKVEVEQNYDKVIIQDGRGEVVDELTGTVENYTSEYVAGDTVTLKLKADDSNTGFGFKVSKIQVVMARDPQN